MSVFANIQGSRVTKGTDLTTTSATEVFTATSSTIEAVLAISIANTDASNTCTAKVEWNDGTTDFVLVEEIDLAAKARQEYDFPLFFKGSGSVKVTAQNADDLHVIVSSIQVPGRVG
ncbi:MAG: hypothetical protein GY807_20535 [Gammaproteobacteria bacterium]|nr:hypothetical protein [Gammaproteobacteria bacterium]